VVTQSEDKSKTSSNHLNDLGITDMRMSLFERLYHRCKKLGWDNALGLLSYQGRMHEEIMAFPNDNFYENNLHVLPGFQRLTSKRELISNSNEINIIAQNRFIFIPTQTDLAFNWKTNKYEALNVLKLTNWIENMYKENSIEINNMSIGIITPYRAQIAIIRKSFEEKNPHLLDKITIDTVERYQGGARDIIILSLCTNKLSQLKSLVSLSKEGIDRKLNVAMTRAREQLIVLGNKEILCTNDTYNALMKSAFEWKMEA